MIFGGGRFFFFVTAVGGYINFKEVLDKVVGTVVGGLFLTVLYFALAQKLLRLPRLSGIWILESVVSETKYNPFRGMVLRYKILLLQDETRLHGTAEKVYEKSDKERVFSFFDNGGALQALWPRHAFNWAVLGHCW